MGVQRAAQEYPRVTEALSRISPGLGLTAGALSAMPFMKSSNEGRTPEQEAAYQALVAQIPGNTRAPVDQAPSAAAASSQKPTVAAPAVEKLNPYDVQDASKPYEISRDFDATDKTDTQRFIKEALKEKTRSERTKEGYNELAPLFQEILGDNKEDMKTNALLMLADAGFKLASSRQPTFAMAVGEAASGLPRGFMGLLAQAKDRDLKIKSSALSQAFTDVQEQDKYAQQLKMKVLDGDFRILLEQIKNGNSTLEDGGAGLRIAKTKQGGFAGVSIDPKDPTVQSAIQSRWTLRDTDNPFVENRGQAPATVETDKGERTKLTASLRAMDNSLRTLDELKGVYTGLYSPGTWVVDKVNNLIVPISAGLVRPDVDQAAAAQRVQTGMNGLIKNLAASGDSGRVAVQEQEWARKTAENIADPVAFFQNKELAAKGFVTLETGLRNARQQLLTQLGYENNDLSMRVPSTGTQNDPFVIPADKDGQRVMFNFLGSTIGKLQDPAAMVYLRMPNNTVQQFNPIQLRGLIGNQ
jgi:hypothetical protein